MRKGMCQPFCGIVALAFLRASALAGGLIHAEVADPERFEHWVLTTDVKDPMELGVAPDGRVFFVERSGAVKIYRPESKTTVVAATIPVFTGIEDGLLGMALDPDFARTHWIYLMFSPQGDQPEQHVSRFTVTGDRLDVASEKVVLRISTQRKECCHSGGSLAFGPGGNLFISVGDNTNPFGSDGFDPIDERPGREAFDAQRSAGNRNDLRGKILRIHPRANGTYLIPEGNLFPRDGSNGRPEIYIMGCRNPFRIAVDPHTGILYWGEVGPDSRATKDRGPLGHDEFNQARRAGNFGWPYFIADNKPYRKYDFATKAVGDLFDPSKPINNSPNNTGAHELPPAQPAWIWYPYARSDLFPELGDGGRSAMAGPVYRFDHRLKSDLQFPASFDHSLIIYDWMRNWIKVIGLDAHENRRGISPFMASETFLKPMDMQFGPDGSLYLVEFGTKWGGNDDSRISRLVYVRGNRGPLAVASADVTVGHHPLAVKFSNAGSRDKDRGDLLRYEWRFGEATSGTQSPQRVAEERSTEPTPSHTYQTPGKYRATLRVTDRAGLFSEAFVDITVGNSRPQVAFEQVGNGTFFEWGKEIAYKVSVKDPEDGSTSDGKILPQRVLVNAVYRRGMPGAGGGSATERGLALMKRSTCFSCHTLKDKSQGPPYAEVARKYVRDPVAAEILAKKIIAGGTGVWGEAVMMPNPQHTLEETRLMVKWVLSLARDQSNDLVPGAAGKIAAIKLPKAGEDGGAYVITATYTDNGAQYDNLGPEGIYVGALTGEAIRVLRAPKVEAERFDAQEGVQVLEAEDLGGGQMVGAIDAGDYLAFKDIDLAGIDSLTFRVAAARGGAAIAVHLDSPAGPVLVKAPVVATGGSQKWADLVSPLVPPRGSHTLYLVFTGDGGGDAGGLLNLNWVRFNRGVVTKS